jgi:hypothetical protein
VEAQERGKCRPFEAEDGATSITGTDGRAPARLGSKENVIGIDQSLNCLALQLQ